MTVALDPNVTLVFIALINLIGVIVAAYVTIKQGKETKEAITKQGIEQAKVSDTITKLEVNTNSLSEKLNNATAHAFLAQGKAEGIASERANPQVASNVAIETKSLPPLEQPTEKIEEPNKKPVSAMNVRIIPDQVIPVKETKD